MTSGLLEKIQRHNSLQEAAMKKILIGERDSKNVAVLSVPRVQEIEIDNSRSTIESKVDSYENEKKSSNSAENFVTESYCNLKDNQENEESISSVTNNADVKIGVQLDMNVKNHTVNSETFEEFAKEVRMRQRAIQEDIYKMDVVRTDVFAEDESDNVNPRFLFSLT